LGYFSCESTNTFATELSLTMRALMPWERRHKCIHTMQKRCSCRARHSKHFIVGAHYPPPPFCMARTTESGPLLCSVWLPLGLAPAIPEGRRLGQGLQPGLCDAAAAATRHGTFPVTLQPIKARSPPNSHPSRSRSLLQQALQLNLLRQTRMLQACIGFRGRRGA